MFSNNSEGGRRVNTRYRVTSLRRLVTRVDADTHPSQGSTTNRRGM
jgi:hypothetical protein